MDRKWLLTVALVLSAVAPAQAGLIPNGDFETGDLAGWLSTVGSGPLGASTAGVEFLDGSNRALLTLKIPSEPAVISAETLTTSAPAAWGNGHFLQFDLGYEYSTDSKHANVGIAVTASSSFGLQILNVTQQDDTPLSGASPVTTYTIPWDQSTAFDLLPIILTQNPGSVSLTVVLDNVRVIPEPSTWVLAATALAGVPFFAARRRRR